MTAILTSDIHLNEHQRDEYRWKLFDWLAEQKADELIINGDLTDAKDRHSARLVNRFYKSIMGLETRFRIILNKGNHDYYDADHPFFEFVGDSSDIVFITKPIQIKLSIGSALFIPAGVKWDFKLPKADYIFTHATFSGAKAENGSTLTGVDPRVIEGFQGKVFSGDVHVPQRLLSGKVEYVGAPYHVRFGDSFDPRVLFISNDGRTRDLYFPSPRKHTFIITEPRHLLDEEAAKGDHVKVRCLLRRADYDKWRSYKEEIHKVAEKRGWLLFGAEPSALHDDTAKDDTGGQYSLESKLDDRAIVQKYGERSKASKMYIEAGLRLMEE